MTEEPDDLRTITMTDRPPVQIRECEWPEIASAIDDDCGETDYAKRRQALAQGSADRYYLRVRRHADGRSIVYGVLDAAAAAWRREAGGHDIRAGEVLEPGDDIVAALHRVGMACEFPERVIAEAIAALPAERL
jgi:hypothetical protein